MHSSRRPAEGIGRSTGPWKMLGEGEGGANAGAGAGGAADATRRLHVKKQTLDDAYAAPANFLEIDVLNPLTTMGAAKKRYTDYEVRMRVGTSSTWKISIILSYQATVSFSSTITLLLYMLDSFVVLHLQ